MMEGLLCVMSFIPFEPYDPFHVYIYICPFFLSSASPFFFKKKVTKSALTYFLTETRSERTRPEGEDEDEDENE
jgi:hypothetical protein